MSGGIRAARDFKWRDDAVKIMVVVSDAPPQDGVVAAKIETRRFKEDGGRVFVMTTNPVRPDPRFDHRVRPEHADPVDR